MHCGCKIFKMAAKVEKFRSLYALFLSRYSSVLRSFFSMSKANICLYFFCEEKLINILHFNLKRGARRFLVRAWKLNPVFKKLNFHHIAQRKVADSFKCFCKPCSSLIFYRFPTRPTFCDTWDDSRESCELFSRSHAILTKKPESARKNSFCSVNITVYTACRR